MKRFLFSTLLLLALCTVFVFGTTMQAVAIDGSLPPEDGMYTVRLPMVIGSGWAVNEQLLTYDYKLEVSKTAIPKFKRIYEWDLDKRASHSSLTLSPGQVFPVSYEVFVEMTGYTESYWVEGQITIHNPAPLPATITGIEDQIDLGDIPVTVDCGVDFPYELGAHETLVCDYGPIEMPDGTRRINQTTVKTDGSNSIAGASASAIFEFPSEPNEEVDACVDVYDDMGDPDNPMFLGTVCVGDSPVTFSYVKEFSYEVCGAYLFKNTAKIITHNQLLVKSDWWEVTIDVPCEDGCTLTLGYWKTHSKYGPAPYDPTWALKGEDTPFFLSGMSWYQVMYGSPSVSKYFILAPQYVAAVLNGLNGASVPAEVTAALAEATTLFNTYTPAQVAASKDLSKQFVQIAELLDMYNNGDIGPGHCSE